MNGLDADLYIDGSGDIATSSDFHGACDLCPFLTLSKKNDWNRTPEFDHSLQFFREERIRQPLRTYIDKNNSNIVCWIRQLNRRLCLHRKLEAIQHKAIIKALPLEIAPAYEQHTPSTRCLNARSVSSVAHALRRSPEAIPLVSNMRYSRRYSSCSMFMHPTITFVRDE